MSDRSQEPTPSLEALVVEHGRWIEAAVRRQAGWLLRVDDLEDLVQDVELRALSRKDQFVFQGDGPLKAWLSLMVKQHLADRRRYWDASRRSAGPMLRVSGVGSPSSLAGGVMPEEAGPGPRTWAEARDQYTFAMRAIDALLPRDQDLLAWMREGVTDQEIGRRLDVAPESAGRARTRAVERFRRAYELMARSDDQDLV